MKKEKFIPETLEGLEEMLRNRRDASIPSMVRFINAKKDKEFAKEFKSSIVKEDGNVDMEKARKMFYDKYSYLVVERKKAVSYLDELICA